MRIEPATARYSVEELFNGIRASIPSRKSWFLVLFMCAWLGGWVMGEVSAIGQLFHIDVGFFASSRKPTGAGGPQFFLMFWLAGWTLGGAFALVTIAWHLFGREIIAIEGSELSYRAEALGLGWTRRFSSEQITHLRAIDMESGSSRRNTLRLPGIAGEGAGSVAFDYGARSYRIGVSLDEAEARLLIQQMKRWLPDGVVAR